MKKFKIYEKLSIKYLGNIKEQWQIQTHRYKIKYILKTVELYFYYYITIILDKFLSTHTLLKYTVEHCRYLWYLNNVVR